MTRPTRLSGLAIVAILTVSVAACGRDDSGAAENVTEATIESVLDEPGLTDAEIADDEMTVIGSYDIDGDRLGDGADGPPSAAAIETFAIYTDLIPAEYREGVIAFVAIDQEASDGTDGALQDVIGADDEPTGQRYLALDITGSSDELERTIVHETGHLIFVEPGGDPGDYAVEFNEQFPPGDEYESDDFVTEYAASVPDGQEDIAESWAMYVFGGTEFAGDADEDGELDEVRPGSLAARKVAFFSAYPELVALRDDILN